MELITIETRVEATVLAYCGKLSTMNGMNIAHGFKIMFVMLFRVEGTDFSEVYCISES